MIAKIVCRCKWESQARASNAIAEAHWQTVPLKQVHPDHVPYLLLRCWYVVKVSTVQRCQIPIHPSSTDKGGQQFLVPGVHAGLCRGLARQAALPLPRHPGPVTQVQQVTQIMLPLKYPCLQLKILPWPDSPCPIKWRKGCLVLLQRSRRNLQVHARDLNAVERGIRGYQYNASGAVKKGWTVQRPAMFKDCLLDL